MNMNVGAVKQLSCSSCGSTEIERDAEQQLEGQSVQYTCISCHTEFDRVVLAVGFASGD